MVFSNVPGPRTPLIFLGKKVNRIVFFAPQLGSLGCSLNIMSHVDNIKICCISDEAQIPKPKELMDIINKNFENVLNEIRSK